MGTKTIGLDDEAYERLKAEKREDESFSDTVKRLTDAVASDWRRGFGRYGGEEGERFERAIADFRDDLSEGLDERQRRVNEILLDGEDEEASARDGGDTDGRVDDADGRDR